MRELAKALSSSTFPSSTIEFLIQRSEGPRAAVGRSRATKGSPALASASPSSVIKTRTVYRLSEAQEIGSNTLIHSEVREDSERESGKEGEEKKTTRSMMEGGGGAERFRPRARERSEG